MLLSSGDEIYVLIGTNFEWKFDKRAQMWPSCYLYNRLILYCGFIIWHVSLNLNFVGKTMKEAVKKLLHCESELLIKGRYLYVLSAAAAQLLS